MQMKCEINGKTRKIPPQHWPVFNERVIVTGKDWQSGHIKHISTTSNAPLYNVMNQSLILRITNITYLST